MKTNKNLILTLILCGSLLVGCNSGGGGGGDENNGSNFNPQPSNPNATNYFSTYPQSNNEYSNIIFQVQNNNGIPTNLAIFSLNTYNSSSENNSALAVYGLSANSSATESNFVIQNTVGGSIQNIGYLQIESNNNIMLNSSFTFGSGSGAQGEKSTILIATKNQQTLNANNYIGHCFTAPSILGVSGNYGNDTCLYTIGNDNSLQITDMSQNNTGPAINLCSSASTWSQSIINPYFYNLNCIGGNGKSLTIQTTFSNFNGAILMNYLINSKLSANPNTVYVGSAIPQSNLSTFTSLSSLQQMNLMAAGSISEQSAILSDNSLISSLCATLGQPTGVCSLFSYTQSTNIPLGVKSIQTPNSFSSYPQIIGSDSLGIFVDNNQYSYYFK